MKFCRATLRPSFRLGDTMHLHIAEGGKGYTLNVYTAGGGKGYTLHVHTAGGGRRYNLHVHTAIAVSTRNA
jgi:hypothetical protein